jgi:two-component system, LytTR family, response regulator
MVKIIHCAIIDDEQHAIELLKIHIAKLAYMEVVFDTTQALKGLELLQNQSVDLLFLDIQMAELNGLDLLKIINGKCKVILTTAYSEYALESYEYGVLDYLLKPITFSRFLLAIQKYIDYFPEITTPIQTVNLDKKDFFVKSGNRNALVKIDLEKLIYIESQGNYVFFYFEKESIRSQLTLKKVEEELGYLPFVRIHQSFIVATKNIQGLEGNQLMVFGKLLPIGDKYREQIRAMIQNRIL